MMDVRFKRGSAQKIVDTDTGDTVAVLIDGTWVDPYGGTFSAEQIARFDRLADDETQRRGWRRAKE